MERLGTATKLPGATFHKTVIFVVAAVRSETSRFFIHHARWFYCLHLHTLQSIFTLLCSSIVIIYERLFLLRFVYSFKSRGRILAISFISILFTTSVRRMELFKIEAPGACILFCYTFIRRPAILRAGALVKFTCLLLRLLYAITSMPSNFWLWIYVLKFHF